MNKYVSKYLNDCKGNKPSLLTIGAEDVFSAKVINQKTVTQNTQQALVCIAAQIMCLKEAQFGFSTNTDNDTICV